MKARKGNFICIPYFNNNTKEKKRNKRKRPFMLLNYPNEKKKQSTVDSWKNSARSFKEIQINKQKQNSHASALYTAIFKTQRCFALRAKINMLLC